MNALHRHLVHSHSPAPGPVLSEPSGMPVVQDRLPVVAARRQAAAQAGPLLRVGLPVTGGHLVTAARKEGYSVLFSANAFAATYPAGHERAGSFQKFRLPRPGQFDGMDVALDSAGFVASVLYGDYRWTVDQYLELVAAHPWSFWASMDYCCEPEVSGDRPLRLLRIAATCYMLGQCRQAARERGLPEPMPVIQGYCADEYALCAQWLPLLEWPDLVGIGSVCRRHVNGPDGILAILEAVDSILPSHTRLHMFGIKSQALAQLANHPRVASVDSQAWDMAARTERRFGRTQEFRAQHMRRWASRQSDLIAEAVTASTSVRRQLFDARQFGGFRDMEELVLEALALRYADLVMGGNLDYRDAVHQCYQDGVVAVAIMRNEGRSPDTLGQFEELLEGFGDEVVRLCERSCVQFAQFRQRGALAR